jgi:hypothetical protein
MLEGGNGSARLEGHNKQAFAKQTARQDRNLVETIKPAIEGANRPRALAKSLEYRGYYCTVGLAVFPALAPPYYINQNNNRSRNYSDHSGGSRAFFRHFK